MPDVAPNLLPHTAGGRFSDMAGSGPLHHTHPPPGGSTDPTIASGGVDATMPAADSSIVMGDAADGTLNGNSSPDIINVSRDSLVQMVAGEFAALHALQ